MKNYIKELVILSLQLFMFYIFPLFAGPTDVMGMILVIILATFLLSILIGVLSDRLVKYLYPVITPIVFTPTVFIYYNDTALVHALWYLIVSGIGLAVGSGIRILGLAMRSKKS